MRELLEALRRQFERALHDRSKELEVHSLTLAGRRVEARVVGGNLLNALWPTWEHLALRDIDDARKGPDLRLNIWNDDSSGPGRKCPHFQRDESFVYQELDSSTSMMSRSSAEIFMKVHSVEALTAYEMGRPLHAPLTIWHLDQDCPVIHCGAISRNGKGLLVGGPAGCGKSFTCLSLARLGAAYLGDDMVALESRDGVFSAHSLYGSTFLHPQDLDRFPELAQPVSISRHKQCRYVNTSRLANTRISAILLPGTESPPGLQSATPKEALLALGPSSIQTGALSPGPLAFTMLSSLCLSVPAYHLGRGTNISHALELL